MLISSVFLLIFCWGVSSKEVPSYVHLCSKTEPDLGKCFVKTVYEIMPHLVKGIPEMDIPPIDPLAFSSIAVNTGSAGATRLDIKLKDGYVAGLKNLKITKNNMDLEHVLFSATMVLPEINIEASYDVNGKILLFEIDGGGHASFNASDVSADGLWSGEYVTKKGKRHIRINKIAFDNVKIGRLGLKLDGLFGENHEFTETVNNAINANIDSLRDELEPLIKETLGQFIRDYFNRVYRLFSVDYLYPD